MARMSQIHFIQSDREANPAEVLAMTCHPVVAALDLSCCGNSIVEAILLHQSVMGRMLNVYGSATLTGTGASSEQRIDQYFQSAGHPQARSRRGSQGFHPP